MSAHKTGRPSKFTPETRTAILRHLRSGATVKATCDAVGVGSSTYFEWLEIGRAHLANEAHTRQPRKVAEREVYAEFVEAVTRASANGLVRAAAAFRRGMNPTESVSTTIETIQETRVNPKTGELYAYSKTVSRRTVERLPGDWRAAMEYLGRRDPDNWARVTPQRVEHSGTIELTWQDEAVSLIKAGSLPYETALETFDHDDALVRTLFAKAQVPISIGQAEGADDHADR